MSYGCSEKNNQYLPPNRIEAILGISHSTLKRWTQNGQIEYIVKPSGHRLYKVPSSYLPKKTLSRQKICYCRVSTPKQITDLNRQVKYCQEKFPSHEVVKDVGSGLNWKRKGLISLLDRIFKGEIEEVVVAHRDRLSRFAYELLQHIMDFHQVKLVVLDETIKSPPQEFVDDILSIITVYSSKYYGSRKYTSSQSQKNQTLSEQRTEK